MTEPGWYPDQNGINRYWDGQRWLDRAPEAGAPRWFVIVWFAVWACVAFLGIWFVLLGVTFGCDSGWEGCETIGISTVFVYAVVAMLGVLGLLLWALRKSTPGVKVAAIILMPLWVIGAIVLSFVGYWVIASTRI